MGESSSNSRSMKAAGTAGTLGYDRFDGFNFKIHPPQKPEALAMADIGGYWEERQRKLETQQVDARLFGSVTNCLGTEADRWWMAIGLSYRMRITVGYLEMRSANVGHVKRGRNHQSQITLYIHAITT